MNVKLLLVLLLLDHKIISLALNLGNVRNIQKVRSQNQFNPGYQRAQVARWTNQRNLSNTGLVKNIKAHRRLGDEDSPSATPPPSIFSEEEEEAEAEAEAEEEPPTEDTLEEEARLNFETQEIQDALNFIQFKMNEINVLIQECIDEQFEIDSMADLVVVKHECVGTTYQVLFYNYREGLRKVKDILLELLKIKLQELDDIYEDEANFFLDMLDELITMDYDLPQSILLAKRASRFYVSTTFYDSLIEIAKPELKAFHKIHQELKNARNEIQKNLEAHEQKEEEVIETLEQRAEAYESAEEAAPEPEEPEEEEQNDEDVEEEQPEAEEEEGEEEEDEEEEGDEDEAEEPEEDEEEEEEGEEGEEAGEEEEEPQEAESAEGGAEGEAEAGESKGDAGEGAAGGQKEGEGGQEAEGRKLTRGKATAKRAFYKKPVYTMKPSKGSSKYTGSAAIDPKMHALQMLNSDIKFKNEPLEPKKNI